jgi:hypothetical protein
LLEVYNIIVFQFPHSTLKKYLRHFFYINMNMQVMHHKSHLILILIYPWCPLDRNQYCDLPSGSSASYHIEVQLNVDVSKSIGATLLLQIGRVIELSVLNTQINPSLLPIIKVYDLSGFEILKFDCVWFNYLRIIVPQHGTNNSGISCVKWSITDCTPFSFMEQLNSSFQRIFSVYQSRHCVCG